MMNNHRSRKSTSRVAARAAQRKAEEQQRQQVVLVTQKDWDAARPELSAERLAEQAADNRATELYASQGKSKAKYVRCAAYSDRWQELGKEEGWLGCSLPKGHAGLHEDVGERLLLNKKQASVPPGPAFRSDDAVKSLKKKLIASVAYAAVKANVDHSLGLDTVLTKDQIRQTKRQWEKKRFLGWLRGCPVQYLLIEQARISYAVGVERGLSEVK